MATQDPPDSPELAALFQAPLAEFLQQRKELASKLKKAGSRDLADRVAKLSKPTPAAWALNRLHGRHPDTLARLLTAAAAVRDAMRAGFAGDASAKQQQSAAERQQREVVGELLELAAAHLEDQASPLTLGRLQASLSNLAAAGGYGHNTPGQLHKELDPPSVEQMAELLLSGVSATPQLASQESAHVSESATANAAAKAKRRSELLEKRVMAEETVSALSTELDARMRSFSGASESQEQAAQARETVLAEKRELEARLDQVRQREAQTRDLLARANEGLEQAERALMLTNKAHARAAQELADLLKQLDD